jgi:tripartite-type tricarboxylate transporter receptor subunit TctC
LKALAVTSPKRVAFVPDVPTVSESGLPGYAIVPWYGLAAPANVPGAIVALLNAQVDRAMNTPEMKASLAHKGMEVQTTSPQQFAAHIRSEIDRNAKLVRAAGAKPE